MFILIFTCVCICICICKCKCTFISHHYSLDKIWSRSNSYTSFIANFVAATIWHWLIQMFKHTSQRIRSKALLALKFCNRALQICYSMQYIYIYIYIYIWNCIQHIYAHTWTKAHSEPKTLVQVLVYYRQHDGQITRSMDSAITPESRFSIPHLAFHFAPRIGIVTICTGISRWFSYGIPIGDHGWCDYAYIQQWNGQTYHHTFVHIFPWIQQFWNLLFMLCTVQCTKWFCKQAKESIC